MNPQPTVTLQYTPENSERFPWVIAIDQKPAYKVAEATHATDALQYVPQLIGDGWTPLEAVRRALQDSQAATFEQFKKVS